MMNIDRHCRVVLVATSLVCGATLGCHRESAETQQLLAATVQSYESLKPKVAGLQTTLAGIHKGVDEIANQIPGGQEFRSKVLATEEVLGVTDARMRWLSGQLQAAKTPDKKKEEVTALADQVTGAAADLEQVGKSAFELTHEKARLETLGALYKAPYERVLSTGYRVKAATTGVEAHLLDFIQDPKKKIDKTTLFDFDRLFFLGAGADIDFLKSKSQLDNVVEILRAFPTVKLKIGGHTDNAGPAARNKKLSTDRAQAVRTALIQMGVAPARLEAEGYGSEHPECPANDSQFCQAQNRRITAHVTAK
jgi:outer membrane protein OmpA-like peptidoglycan-associated protein